MDNEKKWRCYWLDNTSGMRDGFLHHRLECSDYWRIDRRHTLQPRLHRNTRWERQGILLPTDCLMTHFIFLAESDLSCSGANGKRFIFSNHIELIRGFHWVPSIFLTLLRVKADTHFFPKMEMELRYSLNSSLWTFSGSTLNVWTENNSRIDDDCVITYKQLVLKRIMFTN